MASVKGEINRGTWTMSRIKNLADKMIQSRTGSSKRESPVKCPLCMVVISNAVNLKRHMIKLHVNERIAEDDLNNESTIKNVPAEEIIPTDHTPAHRTLQELASAKLDFDPPEFEDPLPASSAMNGDSQGESSNQYEVSSNDESSAGSLQSSSNFRSYNRTKKRVTRRGGKKDQSNTPSPVPAREKPRRLTKTVTRFGHTDSDPDNPDEQDSDGVDFQDSDDDPDFILGKKGHGDDDDSAIELSTNRFRGNRGKVVRAKVGSLRGSGRGNVLGRRSFPVVSGHSSSNRGRAVAVKRKKDAISKDYLSQTKVSPNSVPVVRDDVANHQKPESVGAVNECPLQREETVCEVSQIEPQVDPVISGSVEAVTRSENFISADRDMPELMAPQSEISNPAPAPKRRGRPPTYFKTEISIKTENGDSIYDSEIVPTTPSSPRSPSSSTNPSSTNSPSSTSTPPLVPSSISPSPPYAPISTTSSATLVNPDVTERKTNSKLSSAYNYALQRSNRQNSTIRLPEGPQLTPEQLQIIESQFKSGDFVMAKKDADMMDNPPIWRIDGKSLLQKFQAFKKDGKIFYRNISTYSGWTPQTKALYIGVRTKFVFQSRYDTVVEMLGLKTGPDEDDSEKNIAPEMTATQSWAAPRTTQEIEISDELRSHMPTFEVYLQTLISQALDSNFLKEIYDEYDDYFVDRVKVIDDLSYEKKMKLMEIVKWDPTFKCSLDTWPCINVMITKNEEKCTACEEVSATKLCQLYGQPYHHQTLHSRELNHKEIETKNFKVCERCSTICQLYNKVSHQKYDYYSQCKSTVTSMRVTHPSKHTTTILRDLLANEHWIMGLFCSMCTTWIKVDRLHHAEVERMKDKTQTIEGI